TSAGSLPEGLSETDCFEGVSIQRNKELMRVYRDLELVEQLGSGVPRIMERYGKECFSFMNNLTRMTVPVSEQVTDQVTEQVTEQVNEQVKNLLSVLDKPYSTNELMERLGLTHREYFRTEYIQKSLELGLIEMTIPDKPKSSKQK